MRDTPSSGRPRRSTDVAEQSAGEAAEQRQAGQQAGRATGPQPAAGPRPATPPRVPTVVVDGLHVVYRIYSAGAGHGNATAALRRMLLRQGPPSVHLVHALTGVSFTAYRGEAIGIIGS